MLNSAPSVFPYTSTTPQSLLIYVRLFMKLSTPLVSAQGCLYYCMSFTIITRVFNVNGISMLSIHKRQMSVRLGERSKEGQEDTYRGTNHHHYVMPVKNMFSVL